MKILIAPAAIALLGLSFVPSADAESVAIFNGHAWACQNICMANVKIGTVFDSAGGWVMPKSMPARAQGTRAN